MATKILRAVGTYKRIEWFPREARFDRLKQMFCPFRGRPRLFIERLNCLIMRIITVLGQCPQPFVVNNYSTVFKGPLPQPSKNSSILADKEPIECFQDKGWGSYPKPPFVLHRDRTCLRLIPSDRWNYRHPCPRPRRYSAVIWGARDPSRLVHGDLYH